MHNPYMNNYQNYANNGIYQQNNAFNQNTQTLVRVNGIDGAKAYQMQPNSIVALFDNNDDYFYLKQTDGAGFGSIRTFKFEEVTNNSQTKMSATSDFVTRKELEEYVKQFIQSASTETTDTVQQTAS